MADENKTKQILTLSARWNRKLSFTLDILNEWHYIPNTMDKFYEEWGEINDKDIIHQSASISIYKVYKRNTDDTADHCIVKIFYLSGKSSKTIPLYINETYELMQQTQLLNYYGVYYDTNKHNKVNKVIIAMEPLQQTLKQFVETRTQNSITTTESECKLIISYILSDLYKWHQLGLLHCDICAQNIMLRDREDKPEQNGWKLIDYDSRLLIRDNECIKHRGAICHVEWTPPELRRNAALSWKEYLSNDECNTFYHGTDIWCIGLVILYVLFGKHPYLLTPEEDVKYFENASRYTYEKYHYFTKILKGGSYDIDSDTNKGEIWLKNYLIGLYVHEEISAELFDLLHNYILIFDPRKRASCYKIWNHVWFDEYRNLC